MSTKPDFEKRKSKRKIHPSCSETHRKPNQRVNACSSGEQKPGKMLSKINTSVSSKQENASRGVKLPNLFYSRKFFHPTFEWQEKNLPNPILTLLYKALYSCFDCHRHPFKNAAFVVFNL